jgi:hypothetical protein
MQRKIHDRLFVITLSELIIKLPIILFTYLCIFIIALKMSACLYGIETDNIGSTACFQLLCGFRFMKLPL